MLKKKSDVQKCFGVIMINIMLMLRLFADVLQIKLLSVTALSVGL
jgi:hypothetical protein